jgi:hypothetical protein
MRQCLSLPMLGKGLIGSLRSRGGGVCGAVLIAKIDGSPSSIRPAPLYSERC